MEASSREIRRQIAEINERLTQGEKDTILQEADVDNPEGTVYTLVQYRPVASGWGAGFF